MLDRCRSCGIRFERESGYWVGALIINTAVVFLSFLILFVGGVLITWPDPPWLVLMILTITVNAILPVVFYPQSKTLWMALELSWHPLEESEIIDARRHRPSKPVDGARP